MELPVRLRAASYSLLSGSTESLISVLDHDSYASLSDAPEEEDGAPLESSEYIGDSIPVISAEVLKKRHPSSDEKPARSQAWKAWVVAKAKELCKKEKHEEIKLKQGREEERKQREDEAKTHKANKEKVKRWMEAKELAAKLERDTCSRYEKFNAETVEEKKRKTQKDAENRYQRWLKQKNGHEKDRKSREVENKKREEKERGEKLIKSDEAYGDWLRKARTRPKSAHCSLGYTCGKLIGYHDTYTYPVPAFTNPLPWLPNEIPKLKPARKRPNTVPKTKWNPERYF